MSIIIKTKLQRSKGEGGEKTVVIDQYKTGPRNLIHAAAELRKIRSLRGGFGKLGCGKSWLEVDGVELPPIAEEQLSADQVADEKREYRKGHVNRKPETLTEKAYKIIQKAHEGTLEDSLRE